MSAIQSVTRTPRRNGAKAAKASAAKALQAANPHLVPVGGKVDRLNAAAKNMRIELKTAFPGVKFSIKSSRFSGGNSIDVRWVDGPISKQVDAIVAKYEAGKFNGMDDSYTYTADAWNDAFGDAKYVHTSRDLSDKAIASAIRTLLARHGEQLGDLATKLTVEAYNDGSLRRTPAPDWLLGFGRYDMHDAISHIAYARTWALDQTPKASPMNELIETAA